jgi:phage tail sheath gpL-like
MISSSIRKPGSYSEIDESQGNNALPSTAMEIAVVANRLAAGTVAACVPKICFGPDEAASYWGSGSLMHRMILAAFRVYPYAIVTGCALDDAEAGVAATATIVVAGTATGPGTLTARLGTDIVSVAISPEKTALEIAALLSSEINKYPKLPVTATVLNGTVTLTFKNKGTPGNFLGKYNASTSKHEPEAESTAAGITATVTGFTGGASDPDMDTAFAALSSHRYHLYAIPFSDLTSAQALDEQLESVSDEVNQKGARGYMFSTGAIADATTIAGANARRICLGAFRRCRMPAYEAAAAFAALQASEETPWRAINGAELVGCDAPDIADRYSFSEINSLLSSGVSPFEVGPGEKVQCVRAISTYTANDAGSPSQVWLDSFKIATADYVREAIVASHKNNYRNSVLRDNHVDGEPEYVVTPADIVSNNIAVCKRIETAGGLNNVDKYKDQFSAVRDQVVSGRVNSTIPIDIVDAAHIFANTIKIVSSL